MGETLLINFVLSCIKIDLSSWCVVVGLEMVCGPKLIFFFYLFFSYWCQNHSCMVCGSKLFFSFLPLTLWPFRGTLICSETVTSFFLRKNFSAYSQSLLAPSLVFNDLFFWSCNFINFSFNWWHSGWKNIWCGDSTQSCLVEYCSRNCWCEGKLRLASDGTTYSWWSGAHRLCSGTTCFISSSTDPLILSGDSHLQWDWQLVVTFSSSYPKTLALTHPSLGEPTLWGCPSPLPWLPLPENSWSLQDPLSCCFTETKSTFFLHENFSAYSQSLSAPSLVFNDLIFSLMEL